LPDGSGLVQVVLLMCSVSAWQAQCCESLERARYVKQNKLHYWVVSTFFSTLASDASVNWSCAEHLRYGFASAEVLGTRSE